MEGDSLDAVGVVVVEMVGAVGGVIGVARVVGVGVVGGVCCFRETATMVAITRTARQSSLIVFLW